ncbi:S41 family peptidase [Brachybacterium saurashtrense]|uniref:Tricorn protease homolog n=1 Tax=Brachybacterium saurashtrense TaxID=556288 RepID=A0A345YRD4_9MICO|nr:S41 family peptidase [Brachybacterium saurashtrense]AXK46486.1 biopolymer transporter TolR [Brachybacterium saurashtrense]RRR24227.1 biopolymer transporter TolR [Brachybacterium saurashtrense]
MSTTPAHAAYLRHPDVRGDLLAFTAANDVWLAPRTGGRAWRLTDEGAPVGYPRFSPDGRHVAYTSRTSGGPEVWVIDVEGDTAPRRLTFWGRPTTKVVGWLDDGRVIATTSYGAPLARDAQLWAVDLSGGAELLPLGRSGEVAIHPSGTTVVATPWRRDQASWKHYQGGTAVKLWISHEDLPLDAPAAQHAARRWEPLLEEVLASTLRIAWHGDRLLFASDTPGPGAALTDRASANLWSVAMDGSDLRRHTSLTSADGYLREPATDGETIVFSSRGRLFTMDSPEAAPREVEIRIAGVGAARLPRPASPSENLLAMRPLHDARASVVEWRGSAHALTHRGGPSRLLAGRCGLRLREVRPLGRSPYALFVSDAEAQRDREEGGVGSDVLALARLDGGGEEIRLDLGEVGRILHAIPSPDGSKVAISSHDNVVRLVTLRGVEDPAGTSPHAAPQTAAASVWEQDAEHAVPAPHLDHVREIGRSGGGEVRDLAWSPDGRWLVWAEPNSWQLSRLMVSDTEDHEPTGRALTSGKFQDSAPAFSADGKHLALLSLRTFETVYDDMVFDLGFVNAERPFLLPLERTTADPFGPHPDGWGGAGEEKGSGDGGSGKESASSADGAAQPAAGGATGGASAAGADAQPPASSHSAAGAEDAARAPETRIDLEEVESRLVPFPVVSGSYSHLTAVDGGFVWLRHPQEGVLGSARAGVEGEAPTPTLEHWSLADRKLTVLAEGVTDLAVSGDGKALVLKQGTSWVQVPATRKAEDEDPSRIVIDTSRLRLTVDPVAERRGMLWDNYRIMAQQYWRADMDGMDWHAMTSWYDPAIERVVTEDDFQDLMWEVQGELGTSHAYVQGPVYTADPPMLPAHLGADFTVRDGRWEIARILPGDSSDPDARSPLLAPGVGARVGDVVLRVDGRPVPPEGVEAALLGAAGKATELVLLRDGAEHRVAVTPLADDAALRYQAWVASRREHVAELSGGRLGYLHIPDMVSSGWAQMHRDLREATTKEGLVVDVRYNSGGHTSQLVTDRLARRVLSWDYPRHERPGTYPAFAPRGAVVLVTNQEAGSDGDIVNAVSRALEIGPIIGTRTWGGVIGIDGRYDLVDGTGVTQPKYASWFEGEDWAIENYGVEPDIEVPLPPNAWVAGEDPQLARGVTEALALLEQTPAAVAPPLPAPRFGRRDG